LPPTNHRRADFRDDLTESRRDHGGERESCLACHGPRGPPRSRTQRLGGAADACVDALNRGGRQGRGDRQREQHVADDDRLPGIEPAEAAQRPRRESRPYSSRPTTTVGNASAV